MKMINTIIENCPKIFLDSVLRLVKTLFLFFVAHRILYLSIAVTLLFYFPALKNGSMDAGFLYTGDVLGWYLPALAKTNSLLHNFNFTAIDYSTYNGSSDFFLSPNFFAFHPIVVITSILVNPEYVSIARLGQFLVVLSAIHSFLAFYYAIKLLKRFFLMQIESAILVGILFAFSIYMLSSLGQTPFLLSTAITPWAAYATLVYVEKRNLRNFIVSCIPVIFGLLGGYMPLGVACLLFSMVLVAAKVLYIDGSINNFDEKIRILLIAAVPFLFTLIVVSPYVYSVYAFHNETLGAGVGSLFYSAYEYSQLPHRILSVFSSHMAIPGGREYELSIYWGWIAIPIIVIFASVKNAHNSLSEQEWRLFKVAACIYFGTILTSFGPFSVVSDLVYYFIPQIGRMHVYQRFFIASELMFGVMIALMLKVIILERPAAAIKVTLASMTVLTFGVAAVLGYKPSLAKALGINNYIVMELFLGFMFVCVLLVPGKRFIYIAASVLFSLPLLDKIYDFSGPEHGFFRQSSRIFILNREIRDNIASYFKSKSNKDIIKIIDITPMWTAGTVSKLYADGGVETFPKVLPYFFLPAKMSSFGGFTFYLSARSDYMKRMPVVGEEVAVNPDWDYIKSTGADFLVARDTDLRNGPLSTIVSKIDQLDMLKLPTGAIVIPIANYFRDSHNGNKFDNGYFRLVPKSQAEHSSEGLTNLALGKEAKESSDAGAPARLAVDGNTNGIFSQGSVSHTLRDANAWLDIDLGASKKIDNVTIWNRTDCCGYCLRDFWLFISDKPFSKTDTSTSLSKGKNTWGQQNFAPNIKGKINTFGKQGRYVRIQLPGVERTLKECFLSLAEVQVFGVNNNKITSVEVNGNDVSSFNVIDFQSNDANRMYFEFENLVPSVAQYLFWKNPRLRFYLNGKRITPADTDGLSSIDVPPGRNIIEVRYRHWPLTIFWFFYTLFGILVIWAFVPSKFVGWIMSKKVS